MSTNIDKQWADEIINNVKALISEIERLESYSDKLEDKIIEEREACAKIADSHSEFQRQQHSMNEAIVLKNVAQAIRERGEK